MTGEQPGALLVEFLTLPVDAAPEAIARYAGDYASALSELDGVSTARLYRRVADDIGIANPTPAEDPSRRHDEYLAYYDLRDASLLHDRRFLDLAERLPGIADAPGEPILDRRLYAETPLPAGGGADPDSCGQLLMETSWTVAEEDRPRFDPWYEQEHIPMLMSVPGWLRVRKFERVSGAGSRHFAIHDLASSDVIGHPVQVAAGTTPWRDEVVPLRKDFDRRMYALQRRFD